MRAIDADAFEKNMQNEWERNEISNGEWIRFREMINEEPTIEPQRKKGKWINCDGGIATCSVCGDRWGVYGVMNFCPNCGADMRNPVEVARDIVHEAIDNSVWSDAVDTAKMHKVVDDKYAEIRGDANVDAKS